jgi:hypothetical protein
MPNHVGDRGAAHLDPGASRSPTYQADEHAQTSVSEHGGCHSPRPAGCPDAAEAARPGLLELDAQPSAGRIRLSEGAAGKVSASVRRACIPDCGHLRGIGPEPGTWNGRILIPGDGAAGDQGAQNRLPACLPACPPARPAMAVTRRLRPVPSQ